MARALLRVFPFAAAVWALALVAFAEPLAPRAGVGAALVVAGWALTLWAAGYEEAGRARRAAARGSLFAGPYGWLRNPRQPAGVFVAVGLTLWSGALRPWLAVATALSLVSYFAVVQAAADREAERLLGWDYRAYRATVPIWLPRFTARPRLAAGRWRPARALKGAWPLVAGSVIVAAASLLPGRVGDLLPLR